MKVSKWVDFGQEVDVLIDVRDIAGAIGEAWQRLNPDRFEEEATRNDVISAMSRSLQLFKALTDHQIAELTSEQRTAIAKILSETSERFQIGGLFKNADPARTPREAGQGDGRGADPLGKRSETES